MIILMSIMLVGWIPFTLFLFVLLPPRAPVITAFILGWFFLPLAGLSLAGLPDYNKTSVLCFCALLATLLFHADVLFRLRPRWVEMAGERGGIGVVPALTFLMGWGVGVISADEPSKPEVTWPGMTRSGAVLLPNGWSLRPAGKQARLGDFPVVMAMHPSEPILAVLHAGYGEHEVVTLETETGKLIGRVALPETFAGLAWSPDGDPALRRGGVRWGHLPLRPRRRAALPQGRDPLSFPGRRGVEAGELRLRHRRVGRR